MSQVLDDLVDLLTLEPIEENLFRGRSQDLGFRQLFGGQVIGQSLSAASQTVEEARHVHSMHGYFLRPGDSALPVVYQVDRVRDGGSFSTRRVTAIQKGNPIFTCSASFQYDEEGFQHQAEMPVVVGPENLPSELELAQQRAHLIPEHMREKLLCPKPIEFRPITEKDPYNPTPSDPIKYVWFRADGALADSPALHKYLLAYASDFGLLTTSMQPHGKSVWHKDMQVASLDHALWFHADLRADDWLLYAMDSPWAGNSRGFTRGSVFNRAGQLVASVTQEGLIRYRKDWA
ncbi:MULTISPECIES: acyl-CoA thioesterase II [unclassified Pseudomonas]|uniref:acyl-CoA thioesterase II n=1 Tax=unclassified Pseudomonas TaxID=196821 RepID=UPI00139173B9|nr:MULTISPECIES: acyl-CoA thioesterase II [unclassified Pseudomonas]MBH1967471.1 acyl-CoA thioesterase II [Pseudomonadales bacterium]KAI2673808.1 acyl-CoA thioesterase II [Pseudomonas sp. TNT3]MBF4558810.1 acyl-CoA thioesterase II [Pseudomonas sp. p50(2008)]MBH2037651.1 acyl-CoA thioesterase II [Pseudomonadales bacterium]MBH2074928.1 acyl-CoA thioesterase II [Pseudomonadales bacterium]